MAKTPLRQCSLLTTPDRGCTYREITLPSCRKGACFGQSCCISCPWLLQVVYEGRRPRLDACRRLPVSLFLNICRYINHQYQQPASTIDDQ